MTREEAITVLKGLSENPLFSNQHKAAFNIAIHDINQRHDWDINNLILINKDNNEPIEQEPKTGQWILADEQNKEDVENDNYRFICSECQCSDIHAKGTIVPYCWKCGAKMAEPQESEGI